MIFWCYHFLLLIFAIFSAHAAKKCPGKCISNVSDCKAKGGKVVGYCTNELACCDHNHAKVGSCGSVKSNLATAWFQSPSWPNLSSGDLICTFELVLNQNATGIFVDFNHVVMDGVGFIKDSPCESDMFFFKGFPNWTPPAQCGNLTNYVAVIDLGNNRTKGMTSLKIVAQMSSRQYRWRIKISQVIQNSNNKPDRTQKIDDQDDIENGFENLPPMATTLTDLEEGAMIHSYIMNQVGGDTTSKRMVNGRMMHPDLEEEPWIVNGIDTDVSKIPWQASLRTVVTPDIKNALRMKNCSIQEGRHFCGGSIISRRHILSCVHCFNMGMKLKTWERLNTVRVVLGDSNLCDEKTDGIQEFRVEKVFYHYGYDPKAFINDLVIIKLDKDIKFTDKIQMIKLAEENMIISEDIKTKAFASGWGLTNLTIGPDAKPPEQLQLATDLIIGNSEECMNGQFIMFVGAGATTKTILRFPKYENVYNSLICTLNALNTTKPRVVGQGDSGGPIFLKVPSGNNTGDREPTLVGVISYMVKPNFFGDKRNGHYVSTFVDFYQRVSFYRKWIDLVLENTNPI